MGGQWARREAPRRTGPSAPDPTQTRGSLGPAVPSEAEPVLFGETRIEPLERDEPDGLALAAWQAGGPPAGPLPVLAAPPEAVGRLIAAFAPWLAAGRELYCLDGANCFNPYRLTALLRRHGLDPQPLLARLWISRAYTCHQLLGGVETLLGPLAERPAPPAAAILGVDRLFLDEDLPLWERRYLFDRILTEAEALRRRGLPLLVTHVSEPDRSNPWLRRLGLPAGDRAQASEQRRTPGAAPRVRTRPCLSVVPPGAAPDRAGGPRASEG